MPATAPNPSGLVAGSGSTTGSGGRSAATNAGQPGMRPGQPSRVADRWSSASTIGVPATDTPVAGTWKAPAARARRSHRVDSGNQTSGRTPPASAVSSRSTSADSRGSTVTSRQCARAATWPPTSRAAVATLGATITRSAVRRSHVGSSPVRST
jgi:hypothetical protein